MHFLEQFRAFLVGCVAANRVAHCRGMWQVLQCRHLEVTRWCMCVAG
jgi:hypothetical protein